MGVKAAVVNAQKSRKIKQRKQNQPNFHGSTKIVSVGSFTIVIVQKVLIKMFLRVTQNRTLRMYSFLY